MFMRAQFTNSIVTAMAILYLHIILSAFYWLAVPGAGGIFAPTWEIIVLLMLLLAWSWPMPRLPRITSLLRTLLTILITLYFVLGIGQGFARREFGYDVILALHIPYVPELFRMMYNAEPLVMFIFYLSLLATGVGLFTAAIYYAITQILCDSARTMPRIAIASVIGAYLLVAIPLWGINGPVSNEAVNQVDMALNLDERIDDTARKMSMEVDWLRKRNPLRQLENKRSMYFLVVESYGEVLFSDPDFQRFRTQAPIFAKQLADKGYHIRSRYMDSPVFGGSSWMADASLFCGVKVQNQRRFESLYQADLKCLPRLANDAGYRTSIVAPNTTRYVEKEVALLPFRGFYYKRNIVYAGPRFGWSFIPDQFAINYLHRQELVNRAEEPVLAAFILTTSHHPWSEVPPYLEDWDQLGDGAIFHRLSPQKFSNAFVSGNEYKAGYENAVLYSMTASIDYVTQHVDDENGLFILLGDHQPRAPIAAMDNSSWAVPVHVFSRDAEAVDNFAPYGYELGFTPTENGSDEGLERFLLHLLQALK